MPFVQTTREKVEQLGVKALALTLEFDEAEVLKKNSAYLANTLDVSTFINNYSSFFLIRKIRDLKYRKLGDDGKASAIEIKVEMEEGTTFSKEYVYVMLCQVYFGRRNPYYLSLWNFKERDLHFFLNGLYWGVFQP